MDDPPRQRGRPRTLDRARAVESALMQYWEHGLSEVSINDICKLIGASKPGIYREFGNDDGLKVEALKAYQAVAVDPLVSLLKADQPMAETVETVVAFMTQDREALAIPKGCLLVSSRAHHQDLGPATAAFVTGLRAHLLSCFEGWIDAMKQAGELRTRIPTRVIAYQLDALHSGAMRMQREGVAATDIDLFLRSGFVALIVGDLTN